jgi:hypothetical protein
MRRWRTVLPEDAWIGEDPHSIEKAASECRRSGLSPAATSSAPAVLAGAEQGHELGCRRGDQPV